MTVLQVGETARRSPDAITTQILSPQRPAFHSVDLLAPDADELSASAKSAANSSEYTGRRFDRRHDYEVFVFSVSRVFPGNLEIEVMIGSAIFGDLAITIDEFD